MKTLSSESPQKRTTRKVSKPQMEKRRRERINHSLETLRLLMLENTHDENMKNPKVEKAEILESVVHFLKTEKKGVEWGHRTGQKAPQSMEPRPTCSSSEDSYREGMRSCLLRVSHFISSRSHEGLHGTCCGDPAPRASAARPGPLTHPSPPVPVHRALLPAAVGDSAAAALCPSNSIHHKQDRDRIMSHPYLARVTSIHRDARGLLSSMSAAPVAHSDPVWRPWPQ